MRAWERKKSVKIRRAQAVGTGRWALIYTTGTASPATVGQDTGAPRTWMKPGRNH